MVFLLKLVAEDCDLRQKVLFSRTFRYKLETVLLQSKVSRQQSDS